MKNRRVPTLPGDRRKRKCSGCGAGYKVRSTAPAPESPLCSRCRTATARAVEKTAGWGFPLFSYSVKRRKGKPTIVNAEKR
jgi:hypothetical protein